MTGGGVERVPLDKAAACSMCGLPAVCGEKLPGRRHKVRPLCQRHADAVFGSENPLWRHLDAKTQREIVNEWLSAMTILAHGAGRPLEELFAKIAAVNDIGTETVRLVTPMLRGEARDMQRQTARWAASFPVRRPHSSRSASNSAVALAGRGLRGGTAARHETAGWRRASSLSPLRNDRGRYGACREHDAPATGAACAAPGRSQASPAPGPLRRAHSLLRPGAAAARHTS